MNATEAGITTAVCVKIGDSIISDLLMSVYILAFIFGLIFNIFTLVPILQQDHHWKLGVMSCSVAGFFYYSNMYISIYLLCCISVDRCLVITYPFRSKTQRTSCCAWAQCVSVYAVVIVLHIMVLFQDNLPDAHDSRDDRCYETYPMEKPVALFNLLRVGIGFLLPLLVLAVSYWKVLATVGQSPGLSAQVKRKVRMLSFGVIGIFSVCFAPYHLLLLARSLVFYQDDKRGPDGIYCQFEQKVHFAFSCTLALSSLNCVVDPVLYVLVSNSIQDDVKLCCKRGKRTQMDACAPSRQNTEKLKNHLI
ncbi:G protein-coupled receptor 184 isoform X2 [Syngnathoides biaculeatus]|uniref:G protein-coupled receptor 184 isoform X2 n=1 Tax=Syngnathoides biaculeatus TaxID=300417 RepID=UPI002ADE4CBE|nr:G protein-coupled receptor 184 isoform X2 [Syngnathoides biaculeatus]